MRIPALLLLPPALVAAVPPQPLKPDPAWHLRGGMIGGGFVGPAARADWPLWIQVVVGGRPGGKAADLEAADLWKVPDAFLVKATEVLQARRIFTPRLLHQAASTQYAARTVDWQKARVAYVKAWVEAKGMPGDPLDASRALTLLVREGEGSLVRATLQARVPPGGDARLQASFLRMLDVAEGRTPVTPGLVMDGSRPPQERLHAFTCLKHPSGVAELVASFRGTPALDQAAFHAVEKDWLPLGHPMVREAARVRREPGAAPWFLVRPVERASDLAWQLVVAALERGDRKGAAELAKALAREVPASWYAGHAASLLPELAPAEPTPGLVLRAPGDLTWFNAPFFRKGLGPLGATWSATDQALAARGRFDLILLEADPDREPQRFLQAAVAAGQIDLAGRFLSVERRFEPGTLPAVYPTALAPLLERLIREEGVGHLVDPAFVLAMMKNESLFQPMATSGAQAFGLLQLLRPTFRAMMGRHADIQDPESNIRGGLRYYATVARTARLAGLPAPVRHAYILAGYHAGEGRAKRWRTELEGALQGRTTPTAMVLRTEGIPIKSTRQYVTRVLGDAELFRALLGK